MRNLTDRETEITDLFLELLDDHTVVGKDQAARFALSALPDPWLDNDFVLWLSEGTLVKVDRHILRVKYLDDTTHPLTERM